MQDDAYFAGRVFKLCMQKDYRYFLWISNETDIRLTNKDQFNSTCAEPAEGAFLCESATKVGWRFVTGIKQGAAFRHSFFDATPQAEENARALHSLGVPIVSYTEGQRLVREAGISIYCVTSEESRRAEALARAFQKP